MKKNLSILLSLIIICITFNACSSIPDNTPVSKTGFYFDTAITITLYGKANKKYIDECLNKCNEYEQLFSKTIASSDISRINSSNSSYVTVNADTASLIEKGLEYSAKTNGMFDITIGSVTKLWNFTSDNNIVPDPDSINKALTYVNYKNVELKGNQVRLLKKNVSLDLGGIAKGFVADRLKSYLEASGVSSGIIDLGGNILLIGKKPDNSNYNIGIKKPFTENGETAATIRISDKSIVSSGNYERYFYGNDGTLYHHILDTDTGYPVNSGLTSVTIISDKSVDGDALSTTCFTMGMNAGMQLIESIENTEAVFIDADNKLSLSSGLKMSDGIITITH